MSHRSIGSATLLVFLSFGYGYVAHRNQWFPSSLLSGAYRMVRPSPPNAVNGRLPPGLWNRIEGPDSILSLQQRQTKQIRTLPYLSGYKQAPAHIGVVRYDSSSALAGLNYYTSGHGPEVILMDMVGSKIHSWHYTLPESASDDFPPLDCLRAPAAPRPGHGGYFRRALILPGGNVFAIYDPQDANRPESQVLVKLDKNSRVIWTYKGGAHHDFEVLEVGRIYLLARKLRCHPTLLTGTAILEDFVVVLDSNGEELRRVSIVEALLRSPFSAFAEQMEDVDLLHPNTIEVLSGRPEIAIPMFRQGNVLLSLLHPNAIAVLDMEREEVAWAIVGPWHGQHQPTVLPTGNILLFDNLGNHGYSKVIEFNPMTLDINWSYEGNEANGFSSRAQGSAIRLPNGNTLITESTGGRAFEVTPQKRIVWEFLNPARAGEDGELIAAMGEMLRLDKDFDLSWVP